MNFLQLCRRLHQETGMSEIYDFTSTNPYGEEARLRSWINDAWLRLQTMHFNWSWLWYEDDFVASGDYTPDTVGRFITVSVGGVELEYKPYEDFKATGPLRYYTIKPNGRITFNENIDTQTVSFTAYRKPALLSANTDVPLLPEQHRMVIVWMALQDYAMYDEAPELAQKASWHYAQMLAELTRDYLPEMELPGAIA